MKAELVPTNGDAPIPITKDVMVIGRREYCDVQIDFHGLSKRHCVLVKTDGLLVIRDLATTNGTKVNGQRVRWAALLPNDRVTVGGYKMRVYLGADDVPSPSEGGKMPGAEPARPRPAAKAKAKAAPPKPARTAKPPAAARPQAPARNGAGHAPQPSPMGFASPSPLGVPTVPDKGPKDPNWLSPDLLVEDDDSDGELPAPRKAASQAFPSDDEDQVFIIDLD